MNLAALVFCTAVNVLASVVLLWSIRWRIVDRRERRRLRGFLDMDMVALQLEARRLGLKAGAQVADEELQRIIREAGGGQGKKGGGSQ